MQVPFQALASKPPYLHLHLHPTLGWFRVHVPCHSWVASTYSKVCGVSLKMSRNNGKGPKLDLRLSFSRSRGGGGGGGGGPSAAPPGGSNSPRRMSSSSSSSASPPSSCVSSEGSPEAGGGSGGSAMILAGCPRCMMYVMLSREDPKCPKCHSTVLLDFNDVGADHRNPGFGSGKVGKGKRG
ncbi:unnamed protein product [Triticum turgidum subsp. durum]|uniref:GIR1-like zinc ribbon domain-containing protein n=1 Tax=Triticum turgidum subsp. durum TaxID=4567 RepID=A0A9R0VBX0_TRITD|nr:unnamed protein product [Triticum turgidum subsp. durum]